MHPGQGVVGHLYAINPVTEQFGLARHVGGPRIAGQGELRADGETIALHCLSKPALQSVTLSPFEKPE